MTGSPLDFPEASNLQAKRRPSPPHCQLARPKTGYLATFRRLRLASTLNSSTAAANTMAK
jgi:hypothetical protein